MRNNQPKTSFTVGNAGSFLVIVSLVIGIMVLWQKVTNLNNVILQLDEKLYKHTSGSSVSISTTAPVHEVAALAQPSKLKLPTMREIGSATKTDKVSVHGYDRFYPFFLEPLRDVPGLKMLEIGYNLGFSYQMWLQYFPTGSVYFMEKDSGSKFPQARFTGDQGSVADLQSMLMQKDLVGGLDFIIDDGSHHPEHQMVSFTYLFEHGLKPGGVYIIEDTETSYWRSGNTYGLSTEYGKDNPKSAINRLKGLVDVVNRRYQPPGEPFQSSFGAAIDSTVQSIFFGPNAVVIVKMKGYEMKKYDSSTYLWKDKLNKPV